MTIAAETRAIAHNPQVPIARRTELCQAGTKLRCRFNLRIIDGLLPVSGRSDPGHTRVEVSSRIRAAIRVKVSVPSIEAIEAACPRGRLTARTWRAEGTRSVGIWSRHA